MQTVYRYGLGDIFAGHARAAWLRRLLRKLPRSPLADKEPLPVRVRLALEGLGPIFVKLGQVLSTRPDILPPAYAQELARLQDKVPPFDGALARAQIEASLGRPIADLYAEFDIEPVASASVAQVHRARLHSGEAVAVKVLMRARPAEPLASSAEPALKPNQPTHSRPVPISVIVSECGAISSF